MGHLGTLEWGVVGIVLLTAVATGGVVGGDGATERSPTELGDGTATVSVDSFPTGELRFDDGRFGTGVTYLRIPDVHVRVSDVSGTPRLVYRVEIPALDVDRTTTQLLRSDRPRTVTLRGADRGFDPGSISRNQYTATVSVRIQSFEIDRTVTSVNETVEVRR